MLAYIALRGKRYNLESSTVLVQYLINIFIYIYMYMFICIYIHIRKYICIFIQYILNE